MSELQKFLKPDKKNSLNLILFLISIIVTVGILNYGKIFNFFELAGRLILVSSCFIILYLFLSHFRTEILEVNRKTFFIILTILSFIALTRYVVSFTDHNYLFLIPFAIIPVVIRTFYDSRLALFILLITTLLAGFMFPDPFELVLMSFVSGMVAIFTLTNIYKRARLFFTAFMVIISNSILYLGIILLRDGGVENIIWSNFILLAGNGLLILLSYPLMSVFEQRFLFLSDNTLLELADTNQPLLRKLAEEAPGSFQHSLQVANLAEEAARVVNVNPLLVRTGSLYHDVGKIAHPQYFIENQDPDSNPHDNLDPKDSAKAIINHVNSGVILAKNYKVPIQIIDFIRMHHGTTTAYYFLKKYSDLHPSEKNLKSYFTYPGPRPFSKETAIVMMADAVEAASRSLVNFSEEEINEMVERIITLQEQDDQFSEVPLTFKDISGIKNVFKKRLSNIYHSRIAYPDRNS
jgi:putative nucleotidyltransferase with HDIG domain